MRISLLLFWAVLAGAQTAAPPSNVDEVLRAATSLAGAHVGYKVIDLATGATLAASRENEFFTPASNVKLYTTAFALERLGPAYRFTTELRTTASAVQGQSTLPDLRLVGGGDPNLSGRVLPYVVDAPEGDPLAALRDLVQALGQSGVTAIDGDVVGVSTRYPRELIPEGWGWEDTFYGYGAPVSALALDDNTLAILLRPTGLGELAGVRLRPTVSDLIVVNQVVTAPAGKTKLTVDRPAHGSEVIIRGSIGLDAPEIRADVAVADPALFAAIVLQDLLRDSGIAVHGEARSEYCDAACPPESGTLIASHQSAPLSQIIQAMNKPSQNLHAEMLFREAAHADPAGVNAVTQRAQFLAGIPAQLDAEDGSGLTQSDLASPSGTINLLQRMWAGPNRDVWLAGLPIGGVDGTLQHRFAGIEGASRVHAKTGSLRHTNALSGYIETRTHSWLAFSVFVDDTPAASRDVRAFLDNFCAVLLQQ